MSSDSLKFADDTEVFAYFWCKYCVSFAFSVKGWFMPILKYCELWCLKLNQNTCTCMYVESSNPCVPICLDNDPITTVFSVKDLVVRISNDLNFQYNAWKPHLKVKKCSVIRLCHNWNRHRPKAGSDSRTGAGRYPACYRTGPAGLLRPPGWQPVRHHIILM